MANLVFNITREDMLRSKTVEPGWYKVMVKSLSSKDASTDQSLLIIVDLVVVQDGAFKDVPLRAQFSEKAMGFSVPFFAACGAPINEAGGQYDFERTKGKTILVYVKNEIYQGRVLNKIEDYKAAA